MTTEQSSLGNEFEVVQTIMKKFVKDQKHFGFITKDMLAMLQHDWSTQINKAMNTSVASYANKNRNYAKTNSLLARVSIVAATKICGHEIFWTKVLKTFNISIDHNLLNVLKIKDRILSNKRKWEMTCEGKANCSKLKYETLTVNHRNQMNDMKSGNK